MDKKLPKVAYFCMEYGLSDNLPIFSGGLGILAGDYLKTAKELELPIVGIGILWRKDYTTQLIGEDGYPYDLYPNHQFQNLIDTNISVKCRVRGTDIYCKVWKVENYRNAVLYLLDTDLGRPEQDWITQKLYGGADQDRVAQEIILGIGGIRALRALNLDIDIYHLNEGHAVFAGLELIREKMEDGFTFEEAWEKTRKEIVFTTHTPVEAGNETHDLGLLMYMEANNGLSEQQMRQIGGNPFNMTIAALRLSCQANAVSQLHGETARKMWEHIPDAAPITAITNGVHVGTWQDNKIRSAYETGTDIWQPHLEAKKRLIEYIKEKNQVSFDPDVLTIGFARRAAAYKRGGLIFKRMDILGPLLEQGRLQLVYSGKAHPNDHTGKKIIQEIVNISKQYPNIVFLENYNMEIAALMVQGCDAWLNNPLRPMEASGTSGMKAALNGVLNISVIDGWVGEAVRHRESGWLLDKVLNKNVTSTEDQDNYDLEAFYQVLLKEVIPIYYNDRERWINMMKSSIKMAIEKLTSQRMIDQYYQLLYNKAYEAKNYFLAGAETFGKFDFINPS
ncbi:MAG: alpha-glucan family phosphorylase [Clostridia bacterium]|nr:alpha-glucan family phosphorylase [Clostridia bacterium]